MDLQQQSTDVPRAPERKTTFTIPKFDKRLHDAKHNNWDVVFHLTPNAKTEIIQCSILDVDRFSIYIEETGTGEKFWLSKSAIVLTRIMEPGA